MFAGKYKMTARLLMALLLLSLLSGCGTVSNHEVEKQLQELYGKPFRVYTSQVIKSDERAEGIYAARLYIAAPEDDLYARFFVYRTAKETGGSDGFKTDMVDTYGLSKLKRIFERFAKEVPMDISFTYERSPFNEAEEYYYTEFDICIEVDMGNTEAVCQFLSNTIQAFSDETGMSPASNVMEAGFVLNYREEQWPSDQVCPVRFGWNEASLWNETRQEYVTGPLDYSVEAIQNTLLHEIEAYKGHHPELTAKTDPTAPEVDPAISPGITQRADGTFLIRGDRVEFDRNEETKQNEVRIWIEAAQRWDVYVWNEQTRQYDLQTEP